MITTLKTKFLEPPYPWLKRKDRIGILSCFIYFVNQNFVTRTLFLPFTSDSLSFVWLRKITRSNDVSPSKVLDRLRDSTLPRPLGPSGSLDLKRIVLWPLLSTCLLRPLDISYWEFTCVVYVTPLMCSGLFLGGLSHYFLIWTVKVSWTLWQKRVVVLTP